jgi:uncharacterized protein (DUF1499 family)
MKAAAIPLLLAVLASLALLASGLGTRWAFWPFGFGLRLLGWATIATLVAALLGVIGLLIPRWREGNLTVLVSALVISVAAATGPLAGIRAARQAPPIHDISTDLANPPAFVAIAPLRAAAPNPAVYGGPEIAAQQRRFYPEVQPLELPVAPPVVFPRALAAARDAGWEVVASDAARGRIEATATTFWFGFKDDVVVRIAAVGSGSRIDVRSVSRVGRSDVGTNARRIDAYLRGLENN